MSNKEKYHNKLQDALDHLTSSANSSISVLGDLLTDLKKKHNLGLITDEEFVQAIADFTATTERLKIMYQNVTAVLSEVEKTIDEATNES